MIQAMIHGLLSALCLERYFHAGCVLNGKIYVFGGRNTAENIVKEMECYDPELDQWRIIKKIEHECLYNAVVVL